MKFQSTNEAEFWAAVYVTALESGEGAGLAALTADDAVAKFRARMPADESGALPKVN
jgi:hypothetical protein